MVPSTENSDNFVTKNPHDKTRVQVVHLVVLQQPLYSAWHRLQLVLTPVALSDSLPVMSGVWGFVDIRLNVEEWCRGDGK